MFLQNIIFFLKNIYHKVYVPEQSSALDNLKEIDLEHENKMTESSKSEENNFLTLSSRTYNLI